MSKKTIIIWDDISERIHLMEASLISVLKQLKIDAEIQVNCEVPLLSRNRMIGKTPSFQIGEDLWTLEPNTLVSEEDFLHLFTKLQESNKI